jgi:hypothetical protein
MRKLLWLPLLFVALCAHAGFAPGVVDHKPTAAERTKGNNVHTESICKTRQGTWYEQKGQYAYCILPYPDAGKICHASKDCTGHCIAPVTSSPIDHGTCQANDSTDDCGRPHYENGKIIYFNCD